MSLSDLQRAATFVWHAHVSGAPDRAREFYAALLGDDPGPDVLDTSVEARFDRAPQAGGVAHWLTYARVDDVDRAAEEAVRAGGRVIARPEEHPVCGRVVVVADALGVPLAVTGPATQRTAHDRDGAAAFHAAVLGWGTAYRGGPEYHGYKVFTVGDTRVAGLWQLDEDGGEDEWRPYLRTTDVDATVARATGLGAAVLLGPMDAPAVGRLCMLRDPLGAGFALIEPLE
jgi:predicted enzyme related to lactoylglutathione lyase